MVREMKKYTLVVDVESVWCREDLKIKILVGPNTQQQIKCHGLLFITAYLYISFVSLWLVWLPCQSLCDSSVYLITTLILLTSVWWMNIYVFNFVVFILWTWSHIQMTVFIVFYFNICCLKSTHTKNRINLKSVSLSLLCGGVWASVRVKEKEKWTWKQKPKWKLIEFYFNNPDLNLIVVCYNNCWFFCCLLCLNGSGVDQFFILYLFLYVLYNCNNKNIIACAPWSTTLP